MKFNGISKRAVKIVISSTNALSFRLTDEKEVIYRYEIRRDVKSRMK